MDEAYAPEIEALNAGTQDFTSAATIKRIVRASVAMLPLTEA